MRVRAFHATDWPLLWQLLEPTFAAGDTYAFDPQAPEDDIRRAWTQMPSATFVACGEDGEILGTYYIKPNQPGLGAHVCNCGYVVAPRSEGRGIATLMCEHSQHQARSMGFRAMQFNLVVSTNLRAIRLWHRLGFETVGTLPAAFRHRSAGFVDAYVMYKSLVVEG